MSDGLDALKEALLLADGSTPPPADAGLTGELAALAAALRSADEGLLRPAVRWSPPAPAVPAWVGGYRVLGVLGAGGMGVVYRAEQTHPVRRQVAVKVLRTEVATPAAHAGFEAERHALARLCHRNVAMVLDAGVAAGGAPYLVMDLIAGPTLGRYAADRRLGLRDRLTLFAAVCRGVHHAHQRGVIHRDVKPGNVLVAEEDGRPVPKVIDFGVARLLAGPEAADGPPPGLSAAGLVGTLEYLSPELARHGLCVVDARSDVYGLGAVLYELLAGVPPFDPAELRRGGLADALAVIGRGPPTPPSRRRAADCPVPAGQVAGELDWVVGRATDPDPDRRYASAAALADDVERFLAGRAVEAAPPSRRYRLSKFLRRHAVPVAAAAAVAVALTAGIGLAAAGFYRARQDRDRWREASEVADAERAAAVHARDEATTALDLLSDALLVAHDRNPASRLRLDALGRRAEGAAGAGSPRAKFRLDVLHGHAHQQADRLDRAEPLLVRAKEATAGDWAGPAERAYAAQALSELRVKQGRATEALALADEAVAQAALTGDAGRQANTAFTRANALIAANRQADAAAALDALVAAETARVGPDAPVVARALSALGQVRTRLNQPGPARAAAEASYTLCRKLYGLSHLDTAAAGYNLALIHLLGGRPADAAKVLEEGLGVARQTLGPGHPLVLASAGLLGRCYMRLLRDADAVAALGEALEAGDRAHGDKNPAGTQAAEDLRKLHLKHKRYDEAVAAAQAEARYLAARHPAGDWRAAEGRVDLAETLLAAGRPEEAAAAVAGDHAALEVGPPEARKLAKRAAKVRDAVAGR